MNKTSKRIRSPEPEASSQVAEAACSPMERVKPYWTPEAEKHALYNMRADRAEAMLNLVRRNRKDDITLSTRVKAIAVIKRKLINQLRVPTRANSHYHLFRELDLVHVQAAKSIFFDMKKIGPTLRGSSVYYNFETDDHQVMKRWFALEERRPNGIGHAMMRCHGQVLVMARPPFLIEHQSNDEAEGLKMTAGMMTLNSRGVPRFAPPPAAEFDTEEAAQERQRKADADVQVAWSLVAELATRGGCALDRHWYLSLAERFDKSWLSCLSDHEGQSSDASAVNSTDEEA